MKDKGVTNTNRLISEITCLEHVNLPIVHASGLSALLYEIEILKQEVADLPEGREKEWCKQHLHQKYVEVKNHEHMGGMQ